MAKPNFVTSAPEAEPPGAPTSSAEWREFIANLDRQREDAEARLSDLLVQRNALALKLRLGSKTARQKADEIDAAADRLKVEIAEITGAVDGALAEARQAENVEKLTAEVERAGHVHILLQERAVHAKLFDAALAHLVRATEAWLQTSRALDEMSPRPPANHVVRVAPYELVLRSFFPLSVQGAVGGFSRPEGNFARSMAELVDHIDKPSRAWAEGLIPLADIQAAVEAAKAAQATEEGTGDAA
jgi:hypothetical protein